VLGRQGEEEILAELLPLQEEAGTRPDIGKCIGCLYLSSGSPQRALGVFKTLQSEVPNDPEPRAGAGDAQAALGNYRAALAEYRAALRLAPDDERVRAQLAVITDVWLSIRRCVASAPTNDIAGALD
jgi:Flp pilus assembly protein TadD